MSQDPRECPPGEKAKIKRKATTMNTLKTTINGEELTITGSFDRDQAAGLVYASHRLLSGSEPDAPEFQFDGPAEPEQG